MTKYEWKLASFAKGIDPDEAILELEKIESKYGALTPEHVLDSSVSPDALFHSLFTWNDTDAAKMYRLQQARMILNNIEVSVVSDGEPRVMPVYEVVNSGEGRIYKNVKEFTHEDFEQVKRRTIGELNSLRSKLSLYKQFDTAVVKITEAVEIVSEV